jgi:hypothetical protein
MVLGPKDRQSLGDIKKSVIKKSGQLRQKKILKANDAVHKAKANIKYPTG